MSQAARTYDLLVIDDEATDRQQFRRLLKQHSLGMCEIREAADGAAGLKALAERTPDCVLLDYRLPDMTGLEFLCYASERGEPPFAVLLLTGHGDVGIAVAAMQSGAHEYLAKDHLDGGRLWRAVTHAVAQAETRRRLTDTLASLAQAYATLEPTNAALEQAMAVLESEVAGRKQAEAALRGTRDAAIAADLAKTRFLAMTTRELYMPVRAVLGHAEKLRGDGGLSAAQDAHVGAMIRAARHMLELADGVLEFASVDTGQNQLDPVPVAVHDVIEGCIAAVAPAASERGMTLRVVNAADAPAQICADRAALRQAVVNLLCNRLKFTGHDALEVHVLAAEAEGGLRIEVADAGSLVDAEARGQDFREAAALDGAGIGLAIAARIAGLMGGAMGHGAGHGGGEIFWLEIPTADTSADAGRRHRGRVLLVDDIEMNRDVIGGFLRAAGHEVLLAENGKEAVRLAFQKMVDVVLMDVRMPGMDGLEATRQIRALPNPGSEVPILALSAYTMRDQAMICQDAGMDGFVAKPVGYTTLMRAIDDVFLRPTVLNRSLPRAS